MKTYKGEKYIYLLMGYKLARSSGGSVKVGDDNGMVGGQNYYRGFTIQDYKDKVLLVESKSSPHFANYSRVYEVGLYSNTDRPTIKDYINESGENCGQVWVH